MLLNPEALFIARDAVPNVVRLALSDPDSGPGFCQCRQMGQTGIAPPIDSGCNLHVIFPMESALSREVMIVQFYANLSWTRAWPSTFGTQCPFERRTPARKEFLDSQVTV
jgi:hypothetical protein